MIACVPVSGDAWRVTSHITRLHLASSECKRHAVCLVALIARAVVSRCASTPYRIVRVCLSTGIVIPSDLVAYTLRTCVAWHAPSLATRLCVASSELSFGFASMPHQAWAADFHVDLAVFDGEHLGESDADYREARVVARVLRSSLCDHARIQPVAIACAPDHNTTADVFTSRRHTPHSALVE